MQPVTSRLQPPQHFVDIQFLHCPSPHNRSATRKALTTAPRFVLIAMTQIAGEGVDLPALDALVLAAPVAFKGNIIQQIGRVTRGTTASATVFDFHDHLVPALTAAFRKRRSIIRSQGFTQQPGLSLLDACQILHLPLP